MTTSDSARPNPYLRFAGPTIGAAIFLAAVWLLHRELQAYRYADLARELGQVPSSKVLLAIALTAMSYGVLTTYDFLALKYVRHPLPYRRIALASFAGYAVTHNLGFPLLTGAPLRYRLYSRWGVPTLDIAKVVAFYTGTFWIGLLAAGGISFVVEPVATPAFIHAPVESLQPIGFLFLLLLATYLGASFASPNTFRVRTLEISIPPPRLAFAQVLVSSVEWTLSALVLYSLLPPGTISFRALFGVYLLGQIAGILSHVPGGVGVFESVVIFFLTPQMEVTQVLGILLVFRGVYYLLPLVAAAVGLAWYESRELRIRLAPLSPVAEWVSSMVPQVMAGVVFLAGGILLVSGATPGDGSRLAWLDRMLPLAVIELSHLLASIAGLVLLLLARGLQLRLNSAFHLAVALLLSGILLSLLKGLDFEEATALGVVLLGLWACRGEFYRPAALLEERFTPGWVVAVLLVVTATGWLGFFSFAEVEYSNDLWWHASTDADAPRFLRTMLASLLALGGLGLARLLRPAKPRPVIATDAVKIRLAEIIESSPRSEANLALLGDKSLLFSQSGHSFVMYGVAGRSWVAMGDPVGVAGEQRELAWQFRELAEKHAAFPSFYEVRASNLLIYVDMGLTLSKLGEEARVPLERFSLDGARRKGMRQILSRAAKEGLSFEVLPPQAVPAVLPELRAISDDWLTKKHVAEKGFSLGFFDETYLRWFPIAVVRREGRILAFANLWRAGSGEEVSPDLMRYSTAAPPSVMEYLFINSILWAQAEGCHWFSLGMAPLSGLEAGRHAPLWNRLGGLIYRHGEHFYNFQGLRQYKEKFDPVWEPRYLASPGGLVLPRVLASINALVAGSIRNLRLAG